jgi:hypothetical protein
VPVPCEMYGYIWFKEDIFQMFIKVAHLYSCIILMSQKQM